MGKHAVLVMCCFNLIGINSVQSFLRDFWIDVARSKCYCG